MYVVAGCFLLLLGAQCSAMERKEEPIEALCEKYAVLSLSDARKNAMAVKKDAIEQACQQYRSRVLQEVFRDIFDWRSQPTYNPDDHGHVTLSYTSQSNGEDAQHVRMYRPVNDEKNIVIEECFLNESLKKQVIDAGGIRRRLLKLYKECSWPCEHKVDIEVTLNSVGDLSDVTLRTKWTREELAQERYKVCKNVLAIAFIKHKTPQSQVSNRYFSYLNGLLGDEPQEGKKS